MASRDPEGTSNDARARAAQLEVMRQEAMARAQLAQPHDPEQRRNSGRGKVAGARGGLLLLVLGLVLGGLYVLKMASGALRLGGSRPKR